VCVEQFSYNADGAFPTIKMTKEGPAGVGHLNPFDKIQAETICRASGVETTRSDAASVYVTDIDNGDYIKIKGVDFGDKGATKFVASVAATAECVIELRLDSETGDVVGTHNVRPTGGRGKWETQSSPIVGSKGVHDLYITFRGGSGPLMNFDWWRFE
jgi:arabinoxylan arabinofuranohydrolase